MSEAAVSGEVLALVDGSPASRTAADAAIEVASALSRPVAILGVSGEDRASSVIAEAVAQAQTAARSKVSAVEAIQATGEIREVAQKRVSQTPTALVVLGSNPRSGDPRGRIGAGVWQLVNSLAPPVLVVPPGAVELKRFLFCTGGERFIEEGARFAASLASGLGARVTVFHVSPHTPAIYGDWIDRDEEKPGQFLESNSRLARNIRRQVEIFRAVGLETEFHAAGGEVVAAVLKEVRKDRSDLVIVGSSPARGAIRTYMLGDVTREITSRARVPFLVVRSRQPGFWAELWRTLTERGPEPPKTG